jgi:nicotinamide phosphoribosyltransferase
MKVSLIIAADSYKYSHYALFPASVKNNNSYIESRGVDLKSGLPADSEVVFFGLQAWIKEYLNTPITAKDIERARKMITAHGLPFNAEQWYIIVNESNGILPIRIQAIPEGTPVATHVALVQVRATDDRFAWLASFVETAILRAVWYPTTVATLSREVKKIIKKYLDKSSDETAANLPFKLHDFGARGVSSSESAQLGGMAHLVNFMGTDTVEALFAAEEYYNADGPVGYSVPASEHSTITAWGRENEFDAYTNMVDKFAKPGSIVSCVSDSYNIYNAVDNLWPALKDKMNGATLVIRPDSGNPIDVLSKILPSLAGTFGFTVNSKEYQVLNGVRILWGDGINITSIQNILHHVVVNMGYSAENFVFGMGGALLQKVDRDTLKFAMKTNAVLIDDEWVDVYKDPIDEPFKKSKAGVLTTVMTPRRKIVTMREDEAVFSETRLLNTVWDNGKLLLDMDFDTVRENAKVK